ncbi:hypothetical protein IJ670_06760 [bacterium]|nr:hypothetical protein [bacterium]
MDFNDKFVEKFYDPDKDNGLSTVILERQAKLDVLRKNLIEKYYLEDDEIDKLFKIIIDAEIKIEKIKQTTDFSKATNKDLIDFQQKLIDIQDKMKQDYDKKLEQIVKTKFENAKKYLKEKEKRQNK